MSEHFDFRSARFPSKSKLFGRRRVFARTFAWKQRLTRIEWIRALIYTTAAIGCEAEGFVDGVVLSFVHIGS